MAANAPYPPQGSARSCHRRPGDGSTLRPVQVRPQRRKVQGCAILDGALASPTDAVENYPPRGFEMLRRLQGHLHGGALGGIGGPVPPNHLTVRSPGYSPQLTPSGGVSTLMANTRSIHQPTL